MAIEYYQRMGYDVEPEHMDISAIFLQNALRTIPRDGTEGPVVITYTVDRVNHTGIFIAIESGKSDNVHEGIRARFPGLRLRFMLAQNIRENTIMPGVFVHPSALRYIACIFLSRANFFERDISRPIPLQPITPDFEESSPVHPLLTPFEESSPVHPLLTPFEESSPVHPLLTTRVDLFRAVYPPIQHSRIL